MSDKELEAAVVWQDDGHLSEAAIVALADAQDILPKEAPAHLEACESCTRRLGEAALLSSSVGNALAALGRQADAVEVPLSRPLPVLPITVGLIVAALGAAPLLLDALTWLPRAPVLFSKLVPVLARTAFLALRAVAQRSDGVVMVSCASLLVLALTGFGVSRLTPREGVMR